MKLVRKLIAVIILSSIFAHPASLLADEGDCCQSYCESSNCCYVGPALALGAVAVVAIIAVIIHHDNANLTHDHSAPN